MIELLREVAPEAMQQWHRTREIKLAEWRSSCELVKAALGKGGLKTKLPANLDVEAFAAAEDQPGFFETAYRSSSVADRSHDVMKHGRDSVTKELDKSVALVKRIRAEIANIDDWKLQAAEPQRLAVLQEEGHMRDELAKYDRMADDSDRGFMASAGIGCGFGAVALIAHIALTIMGTGGFLSGIVLYVVLGLSILPIVIGLGLQLAKGAQRASVEAQLYAVVKEARKVYSHACDVAEKQAREQFKKLIEEVKDAEQKHATLVDAYRMLGNDPPSALLLPDSGKAAA